MEQETKAHTRRGQHAPKQKMSGQFTHLGRLVQHAALVVGGDTEHTHVQRVRQLHVVQVSGTATLILVGA